MDENKKIDKILLSSFILATLALICNIISFFTPFWIVGKEGIQREFLKIGLWEVCFNNYIHPEDYVSKKYSGCWFVYWPEYDYIRDWLNPPWFYAAQMMAIVTMLCNIGALAIILLKLAEVTDPKDGASNLLAMMTQLIAVCAYIIVTVTMGVMSKDRNWMPRPDHNYLSWSFGLAVLAAFFTLFCFSTLYMYYMVHNCAPKFKKELKEYLDIQMADAGASTMYKGRAESVNQMYNACPGGSTIYSCVSQHPNNGTTSGATASAKVREAMSQKRNPYGGSVASLNSLGQSKGRAELQQPLSRGAPPLSRGSMSSLHSGSRAARGVAGDSVV